MDYFLFGFKPIEPSTWAYLSSLLLLALFFKFNRFWSVRNFDLILIILLAPGLLMVHYGTAQQQTMERVALVMEAAESAAESKQEKAEQAPAQESGSSNSAELSSLEPAMEVSEPLTRWQELQRYGYIWLFVIQFVWLMRLLNDQLLVRKPMLEPNLSLGGLVFLTCSLAIFLFANVLKSEPANLTGPEGAMNLVSRNSEEAAQQLQKYGPGYPLLHVIPTIQTFVDKPASELNAGPSVVEPQQFELIEVARIMAILSQIAIVLGLIYVGHAHFGNFQMGVAMATVFLMLPYTAQYAGDSMHLLPGALLVWAIACYDRPIVAGILIGTAAGVCYYPLFLLPLWISYYWNRGRKPFILGTVIAVGLVVSSLTFTSADLSGFLAQLKSIFGFIWPRSEGLGGIWALNWEGWFRLPMLVGYFALCISYAFWPIRKDLGTLISLTATAMIAVQFWHGDGGGLYIAWFMPLVLMIVFRPNLDHRTAVEVLKDISRNGSQSEIPVDSAVLDD